MAKNQSTYTLKIDAELGNLQKTLNEAKNSLANFMASGEAPKGLEKAFEKINVLLGQISDKTGKPLDLKGLASTGKDLATVEENFRAIIRLLGEFDDLSDDIKLSFLSEEEQKKVTAITNALKAYGSAAEESAKKVKQLEAAQKNLQKDEASLGKARKKVGGIESKKTSKEAELSGARGRLTVAQEAGGSPEKIAQYQAKVTKLEADLTNLNKELAEANKELTSAQSVYDASAKSVGALSKEADRAGKEALHKLKEEAKNLGVSLEGLNGHNAAKQIEILTGRLKNFKTEAINGARPAFEGIVNGCTNAGKAAEELGEGVKEASESVKAMDEAAAQRDAFESKIKSFLGLSGAAQVLRASLRDAMATITELDATMTQMAVVTDLSVGDYWKQLPEYSKRASELGVSINDAYKAATLYYQQGLKSNEVTAISAETLKLAKIAGIEAADATDKMTAALRGFNMELNDASAQKISDVYSELAAITAADVDEISTAMTKTASIASSAGMEFETTAAFLSQIIETTRESAETAGTAMKTVIARFQELKKSPNEIGEIDGEIVDANAIETALRSVGVSLRDAGGQFRELDDVFLELSGKWNTLDKNTQRYIATIAAGSRQQSRFIAMMQDYGRTQELVSAANNSAGASQEQFAKTMESLEAKVEKLKNAWHEFTMGIMNSDLVKFGVDILTKFLEIVNKATSALDGIGGSLTKIISIVAVFKLASKIFGKIKQPLISFFADVVKMSREEGEKAGKAFDEGARAGAVQKEKPKEEKTEDKSPQSVKSWFGDKTGITNIKEGLSNKKKVRDNINSKRVSQQKAQQRYETAKENAYKNPEELISARKELAKANKEYKESLGGAKDEQEALLKAGQQGSIQLASGMQQAGQAAMGLGMAVSMVGGALSAAGFEEAGEALSQIGNWAMIAGTAISALGPIVSAVSKLAQALGISTAACWGWVLLIVAGIAILVAGVIAIYAQIQNNSPEKKLENAAKNAEAAADAAERAKENYEALNGSLDDLGDKQKELENLTKGTNEWNDAVQEVNSSVLNLIDKYPELAGLVENKGGVLTLDVESEAVQSIIGEYEKNAVAAKGASVGAKANQNRAELEYDLDKMDDKVFEKFQTEGQAAAVWTAIGNTAAATAIGAASGAAIGAGTGALIGSAAAGVGAGPGALIGLEIGAIAGAITGLVGGIASFQYTVDQVEKNNEQNRENVKELAQAYANGETGETVTEIAAYIERNGIAVGDAAEKMAQSLLDESETMLEFGQALNATDAAQKAYYQAMATNAQQLIDLGAHSEKQIEQMNTVVDEELMKSYEDQRKTELTTMKNEKGQGQFNEAKKEFVKQQYGSNAKIEGNKVLDEKGEVIREFTNDDAWIAEMAAADATLHAAEAMTMVPDVINDNMKIVAEKLGVETQKAFEKAFSGQDLTKGELSQFEDILGEFSYNYTDAQGNTHSGTIEDAWDALDANQQSIWGSKEAYARSLDKDYAGVQDLWNEMSNEQKEAVYGGTDEAAYERFEATFTEILDAQNKAFSKADENIKKVLGETATYSEKLSSAAAQAWTNNLKDIYTSGGDVEGLNNELTQLLQGMSAEDANAAMAQINAIDKMSIDAWEDLSYVFENLGIEYSTEALNEFIEKGIEVSGAIRKIDFSTLANDINETYKLLDKVKEGGRTYSEEDYKLLIAANKSLEKSFTKIGDEFIYTGGSIETLTNALQENTIAVLQDANTQLKNKIEMGEIVKATSENKDLGSVEAMDKSQLRDYLITMRSAFAGSGKDLASLGIEGLSMSTSFINASTEDLQKWATEIAQLGGSVDIFKKDYAEGLRNANIQRYVHNDASYNAQMATQGGEYADEHQEALILQAIQSGGVSNTMIEAYRKAIEDGNKEEIDRIGAQIAVATEKIVEASEGRDAYQDLVERVTDAIIDAREKEIDKLSEVNDSINSANDKLVNKLQQQIDADRTARENEKTEQSISDMYSQAAYLAMDTSGSNMLQQVELGQSIEEAEQSYQDQLIDQAIQNLQDANAHAADQRERQISLLEAQLQYEQESGQITRQAEAIVVDSLTRINNGEDPLTTEMGELLWGAEGEKKGLSGLATESWVEDLQLMSTQASNWLDQQGSTKDNATGEISGDKKELTDEEKKEQERLAAAREKEEKIASAKKTISDYVQAQGLSTSGKGAITTSSLTHYAAGDRSVISALNTLKTEAPDFKMTDIDDNRKVANETGVNGIVDTGHFPEAALVSGHVDGDSYTWGRVNYLESEFSFPNSGSYKGETVSNILVLDDEAIVEGSQKSDSSFDGYKILKDGDSNFYKLSSFAFGGSDTFASGYLGMLDKVPYMSRYVRGKKYWVQIRDNPKLKNAMLNYLNGTDGKQYKTGGLADFTGPAWLDGTKSRPEYVLNAAQTERFFSLVDVLEGIDKKDVSTGSSGDNYFDINISVEKLENDYDVEQMADKIRRMIYDDATYRNVNVINHIR